MGVATRENETKQMTDKYAPTIAPYLNANYVVSGGVVSPTNYNDTKFVWIYDYELRGQSQVSRQYFTPNDNYRLNLYGYLPEPSTTYPLWSAYEIYDLSGSQPSLLTQGTVPGLTSLEDALLHVNDYFITQALIVG